MQAIKVRYLLNDSKFKKENEIKKQLVYAEISGAFCRYIGAKRIYDKFQVSLEANILPKDFGIVNKNNNYVFDEAIFNKYSLSNKNVKTKIGLLQLALNEVESYFTINDIEPSAAEFKTELFIKLKRTKRKIKRTVTILEFLTEKIKEFKSNIGSGEKNEIKNNTIKSYVTLSKYIVKYQTVKNVILTFSNFTEITYKDFWIVQDKILRGNISIPKLEGERKQKIQSYGFLINGIVKYQKTFIAVLGMAKKANIEIAIDTTNENLVLKETENSKDIYINEIELQKILDYKPLSKEVQTAKDYTILSSMSGMRFESMTDAYGVEIETFKEGIHNFHYIHSKQNKTQTECIIPLFKPALEILETYNNCFPKFSDNATVNEGLKVLFDLAGVKASAVLTLNTFRGGVLKEKTTVNEIISTHDLRKSFATNLFLKKVSQNQIDNVTHPDKQPDKKMSKVYNKAGLLDLAILFVDEVQRVNKIKQSKLYTF